MIGLGFGLTALEAEIKAGTRQLITDVQEARALLATIGKRKGRTRRAIKPRPDFEALLAFQISTSKLPTPERQVLFASGRKMTADFGWPEFRLLVEVQGGIWRKGGGAHGGGAAIERDIEKSQLAVINGWSMFPVTTDEVKNGKALQLIELALQKKGWKR